MKSQGKSAVSVILYAVAIVVFLVGVASLVNNIVLYKDSLAYYVAQGYTAADVNSKLFYSTLLPTIFESIVYCGIAFGIFGIGSINKKVSSSSLITDAVDDTETEEADISAEADE